MKKLVLALSFALLPLSGFAGMEGESKEELASSVLDISGADEQFQAAPILVAQTLEAQRQHFEPEAFEALKAAIIEAFNPEKMKQVFRKEFTEKVNEKALEEMLAFYATETGDLVMMAESEGMTPEGQQEIQAYIQEIDGQPLEHKRYKLLVKLDQAMQATESVVDMTVDTTHGVMKGFNALVDEADKTPKADMDKALRNLRKTITPQMKGQTMMALVGSLRHLSNQDLKQYLKFLTSKPGQNYSESMKWGMNQAYLVAINDTENQVNQVFE